MSTERNSWGFSIFCDDLRQEIAGKFSLMGIYSIDMIFQNDFPVTLPKFAILVKYFEIFGTFEDDLSVNIFLPGDQSEKPFLVVPIKRSDIAASTNPYPVEEEGIERLNIISIPVILSPLSIVHEGFIKVRVKCGEIDTKLGRLMLRKLRPGDQIQF